MAIRYFVEQISDEGQLQYFCYEGMCNANKENLQ